MHNDKYRGVHGKTPVGGLGTKLMFFYITKNHICDVEMHTIVNFCLKFVSRQMIRLCNNKKGKADHARMGIGGVLISLTLAVSL